MDQDDEKPGFGEGGEALRQAQDEREKAPPPRRRRKRRRFDARAEAAVVRALRGGASVAAAAKAAGFAVSTLYAAKARSAEFRALCDAAVAESDGEVVIAPGNGRALQFRRVRRRLFSAKLKDAFLEHFAGTCSIAASAEAIGVGRSTVNKHLAEDEDFRARYDRTVEIAYRLLDSELLRQRLEAAQRPQVDGGAPADPGEFDRALQLLREHKRGRPGGPDRHPGRPPRHATLDEVCKALAKRLKAFPPTAPGEGDPPSPAASADEGEAPDDQAALSPGQGCAARGAAHPIISS